MAQVTLLAWQALKLSREVGGLLGEGIAEWVLGQALAASNPRNYQEAETHFARSIEAFETSGAKLYLAQAYTS